MHFFFFYSGWDYWGVPTKLWRPRWRHTFETAARTVHPSRLIRSSWNATTTHNTQHTKFKKKTAAEKRPNTTHPTNTTRNEKRRIKNKKKTKTKIIFIEGGGGTWTTFVIFRGDRNRFSFVLFFFRSLLGVGRKAEWSGATQLKVHRCVCFDWPFSICVTFGAL